jgi:hypothetical protein
MLPPLLTVPPLPTTLPPLPVVAKPPVPPPSRPSFSLVSARPFWSTLQPNEMVTTRAAPKAKRAATAEAPRKETTLRIHPS